MFGVSRAWWLGSLKARLENYLLQVQQLCTVNTGTQPVKPTIAETESSDRL